MNEFKFTLGGRSDLLHVPVTGGYTPRPTLRGTQITASHRMASLIREVYCDGTVHYQSMMNLSEVEVPSFYAGYMMAFIANALVTCDRFRSAGDFGGVEYGLEVEISVLTATDIPVLAI